MPAIAREHYERRKGYANYYFNKQEQERLAKALAATGDFSLARGDWKFAGDLVDADKATFELDDEGVVGTLPGGQVRLQASHDLSQSLDPIDSGGLLAALHLWRHLLINGPAGFDQVYYLGTLPWSGEQSSDRSPLCDVLVAVHAAVECHFLFDTVSGQFIGMEMFADEQSDPCTLYFYQYEEAEGRHIPRRWEVRYGDDLYGMFQFTDVSLATEGNTP